MQAQVTSVPVYTKTGDGSVKRAGVDGVARPAISALVGRLGVEAGAAERGSAGAACSPSAGRGPALRGG